MFDFYPLPFVLRGIVFKGGSVMGLAANIASDREMEPAEQGDHAEVVVHISDELGVQQRKALLSRLFSQHGIVDAKDAELRGHIMVVKYDRKSMSSQDVINAYRVMNLDASCIVSVK